MSIRSAFRSKSLTTKIKMMIHPIMTASVALLLSFTPLSPASATSLDLSLNNETVRVEYLTRWKSAGAPQGRDQNSQFRHISDLHVGGNFLYHEDDGYVAGLSAHVSGRSRATLFNQHTGIGGKLVVFDAGDFTGTSVAVGGYVLHNLPSANLLSVRGELYYAPSVVTFGDGDRYLEFSARLEYKIVDPASIFIGYRNIEVDFETQGDVDIDARAHLGILVHF